jgi:HK97 family phage major capsid protein
MKREDYLNQRETLLADAETALAESNLELYNSKEEEVKLLDEKFDKLAKAQANMNAMKEAQPKIVNEEAKKVMIPAEVKNEEKKLRVFKNFGEQLAAIKNQTITGIADERLNRIQKEFNNATGMNIGTGSDGGFAIQTDFAGMMMESAATSGNILPLVDRYNVSDNADSVRWVDIDETSVATTVYGGVQVYWAGEADTVTAKKPKLSEKELKLHKLMGVAYTTYELDAHSNFSSDLYTRAFEKAIQRELESTIIAGNGVGKPLGFQNGGDIVSVAKESGQTAATVVYENIVKMYNRSINKQGSVWVVHPDVQEQLDFMSFPVGVGGVPVYLGASSQGTLATLKGRSVIESDHCAALGTVGDINFMNLEEYMLITKGGTRQDYSIHVQFLAAENCFRFIFFANGMPKRSSTLTIKNSSNARSNCVKLATRA